jgi:hypothetical protein
MNTKPEADANVAASSSSPTVGRRSLVAGVGVAGAVAVTAQVVRQTRADPEEKAQPPGTATEAKGYRLTAHVQRYYETTKA